MSCFDGMTTKELEEELARRKGTKLYPDPLEFNDVDWEKIYDYVLTFLQL